jgi:hypothetical protein
MIRNRWHRWFWAVGTAMAGVFGGVVLFVTGADRPESERAQQTAGPARRVTGQEAANWDLPESDGSADTGPVPSGGAISRRSRAATADAPFTSPADPVSVGANGTVSVHVDGVPLAWLLRELQDARDDAGLPPALGDATCVSAISCVSSDYGSEGIADTLRDGSEAERYAALVYAEEAAIHIPPHVLQTVIAGDDSERVRLAAFTHYVAHAAVDPESLREVLALSADSYGGAVQAEARRQLQELGEYQELQAPDPQQEAL